MVIGKDILGSVKTATSDGGALEDKYEYDAFGTLYQGDLSGGMNLGYLGKPYDSATGLYNYGYRDYSPQAARFTTVDPVRDGSNWYAYVNNDPVNYVDLWGLDMMYSTYVRGSGKIVSTYIPTNSNGSIDYANIKNYSFSATNNVVEKMVETMPVGEEKPELYYPQQFPVGTWNVLPSRETSKDEKKTYGDVVIRTNATQWVDTYGTTQPAEGAQPTNRQQDQGYAMHYSDFPETWGCIRIGSQSEANLLAALSDQALNSPNGRSQLSVIDSNSRKGK